MFFLCWCGDFEKLCVQSCVHCYHFYHKCYFWHQTKKYQIMTTDLTQHRNMFDVLT